MQEYRIVDAILIVLQCRCYKLNFDIFTSLNVNLRILIKAIKSPKKKLSNGMKNLLTCINLAAQPD